MSSDPQFSVIERELYIEASPEIVFDVVSRPEHVAQWWPDEARFEPVPGSTGEIVFGDRREGKVEQLTVVDVHPPHTFSFRWVHHSDEPAAEGNSLLVTFHLTPSGAGTLLKFSEVGFREMGWEAAFVEETYNDHVSGWNRFLPRLVEYAGRAEVRP